jgi:hypothetical protein
LSWREREWLSRFRESEPSADEDSDEEERGGEREIDFLSRLREPWRSNPFITVKMLCEDPEEPNECQ